MRTAFNLLGPLTNPAGVRHQLVGVPRAEHTDLIARSLGTLGSYRAWVAHGADGLDEVSTTGYTKVSEYFEGRVRTFHLHPSDFGVSVAHLRDLRTNSPEENEAVAREVLRGQPGPARDMVLVNAAVGLVIMTRAKSLREGTVMAAASIDEGRARTALDRLVAVSNGEGETSV